MIEYVLITIIFKERILMDVELPAQVEIHSLEKFLLESLQSAEPQLFSGIERICLKCKGTIIENGTLFDNKIWDGNIVEIVERKTQE